MENEYIDTLCSYLQDIIYSEVLRIIKVDYNEDTTYDYDFDDNSKELKQIDEKNQDQLLEKVEIFTMECTEDLKSFLKQNKINLPKIYEKNKVKILDFLQQLIIQKKKDFHLGSEKEKDV